MVNIAWRVHAVERLWDRCRLAPDEVEDTIAGQLPTEGIPLEQRYASALSCIVVVKWLSGQWVVMTAYNRDGRTFDPETYRKRKVIRVARHHRKKREFAGHRGPRQ